MQDLNVLKLWKKYQQSFQNKANKLHEKAGYEQNERKFEKMLDEVRILSELSDYCETIIATFEE
jgi:hypothetical protein